MQRRSNPAKSAVISQRSHPTQTDNLSSMQPMHIRLPWFTNNKKSAATHEQTDPGFRFCQATQYWSLSLVPRFSATKDLQVQQASMYHIMMSRQHLELLSTLTI